MQISLRSPMIAGTAAVGCAAAIAVMPLAPAVSLPALSTVRSDVSLSAFSNPITALMQTGAMALNYLLTPTYGADPVTNWPASGIGEEWNGWLQLRHDDTIPLGFLPYMTAVGVIPNFLQVPFPMLSQMVTNWVGYAGMLFQPNGLATIVSDIGAKVQALGAAVAEFTPLALRTIGYQINTVAFTLQSAISSIVTSLATGDLQGAWNAAVDGLLGPNGVAGKILNVTIGAGVQYGTEDPIAQFVPSVRYMLQTAGQEYSSALQTTAGGSGSAAATTTVAGPRSVAAKAAIKAPSVAPVTSKAATADAAVDTAAPAAATTGSEASPKPAAKPAGLRSAAAAKAAAK